MAVDQRVAGAKRHGLVTFTAALLAVSYVPLEFGLGTTSTAPFVFALCIVLAYRYRVFDGRRLSGLEVATGLLMFWILMRLVFISAMAGEPIPGPLAARELLGLFSGLILFRLGRRDDLKSPLMRGVGIGFVISVVLAAYQMQQGTAALIAAGYTPETGYNYYTLDGALRPFGTFAGPTTFGTFAVMSGLALVAFTTSPRLRALSLIATVGLVAATETRAALFGAVIAIILLAARREEVRKRSGLLVPGAAVVALFVLFRPGFLDGLIARVASAGNANDTSRSTRVSVWSAVIRSVDSNGRELDGFGGTPWVDVMTKELPTADLLAHAHSNFFQVLFRYGYPGLLLFGALVVFCVLGSTRARRMQVPTASVGIVAASLFLADSLFNNSLSSASFVLLTYLLLGVGRVVPTDDDAASDDLDGGAGRVTPHGAVRPDGLAERGVVKHRTRAPRRSGGA